MPHAHTITTQIWGRTSAVALYRGATEVLFFSAGGESLGLALLRAEVRLSECGDLCSLSFCRLKRHSFEARICDRQSVRKWAAAVAARDGGCV